MKLDNLLLLAGGGYLLYTYMQKKNDENVTQAPINEIIADVWDEAYYENDENATPPDVVGCMNEEASNYNPLATAPFGDTLEGCIFAQEDASTQGEDPLPPTIFGCMNGMATNYNPMATEDDNTCYFPDIEEEELSVQVVTDTPTDTETPFYNEVYDADTQEAVEELDTSKG